MTKVVPLGLDGVFEITPAKHCDERGFFSETWSEAALAAVGVTARFVQDNHVRSTTRGVLRGLHYQLPPKAQDKLVRVAAGAIFCVIVDVRRASRHFGDSTSINLSGEAWSQVFVPRGYALGYVTLTDTTDVLYKVSEVYAPQYERAIRYDDPSLGIEWPSVLPAPIQSPRDRAAPPLAAADVFE